MRGIVFTGQRGLELMSFPDPTPDAVTWSSKSRRPARARS
jgi:hypothetical protein